MKQFLLTVIVHRNTEGEKGMAAMNIRPMPDPTEKAAEGLVDELLSLMGQDGEHEIYGTIIEVENGIPTIKTNT